MIGKHTRTTNFSRLTMMFGTTNLRIDVFVCVAGGEKCIMEVNLKGGLRVVVWSVWGIGTI